MPDDPTLSAITPRGWRWWLFVGVAHETPRMRYERPRLRIVRQLAALSASIGVALTPAIRRSVVAYNEFAAALAGVQHVIESTLDEAVTPSS